MLSSRLTPAIFCALFAVACGPARPGEPGDTDETDSGPGTTSGVDTLTGGTASPPEPTTGGPSTGPADPTGGVDPTGDVDPPETTGGPDECPKGQVPFAPRWEFVLEPPFAFAEVHPEGGLTVMADGRVAVAVRIRDGEPPQSAAGVLVLSPAGELLGGPHPGAFGRDGPLHGIVRAGDEVVLAGHRLAQEPAPNWVTRFVDDGVPLAEVPAGDLVSFTAALGMLDAPVLLGLDDVQAQLRAVKLAGDGVGLAWSLVLDNPPGAQPVAVAADGQTSALLVTQADPGQGGFSWLGLQVVDSAGATLWAREIDGPAFGRATHATAIPGGWVVLQTGDWSDAVVRLTAISAVDGATLWDAEVAAPDDQGPPLATRVHLAGDRLVVPVVRSPADSPDEFSAGRSIAAHLLSLEGASVGVMPLAGADTIAGPWELDSAVGPCGELIVLAPGGDRTWFGGYDP